MSSTSITGVLLILHCYALIKPLTNSCPKYKQIYKDGEKKIRWGHAFYQGFTNSTTQKKLKKLAFRLMKT